MQVLSSGKFERGRRGEGEEEKREKKEEKREMGIANAFVHQEISSRKARFIGSLLGPPGTQLSQWK